MLLSFYIEDEYVDQVLMVLDGVKHEGYYANMAAAWAISICFVKYSNKTITYFKKSILDDFTYNKALQKILESSRVDREMKAFLRSIKRK